MPNVSAPPSSSGMAIIGSVVIVVVGVVYYVVTMLGYGTSLEYHDAGCKLVNPEDMAGSEDFTSMGGGAFLVSSADFPHVWDRGWARKRGQIFEIHLNTTAADVTPQIVSINGMPGQFPFNPHGMYFSQQTNLLYIVSHGGGHPVRGGGSRVIIARRTAHLQFEYVRAVTSPMFPNGGLNDIVEGATAGEFYVSVWLAFAMPENGLHHPRTPTEKWHKLLSLVTPALYRGTYVLRCTYEPEAHDLKSPPNCEVAASGFFMANGITKRPSDNLMFVSDLMGKRVHVYKRDAATGALLEQPSINVRYPIDNLEYEIETGEIHAGSIPILHLALKRNKDASVAVPGGLTVLREDRTATSGWSANESAFMHDGTKLSHISAAARYGGVTVLGSPYSHGMLLCRSQS